MRSKRSIPRTRWCSTSRRRRHNQRAPDRQENRPAAVPLARNRAEWQLLRRDSPIAIPATTGSLSSSARMANPSSTLVGKSAPSDERREAIEVPYPVCRKALAPETRRTADHARTCEFPRLPGSQTQQTMPEANAVDLLDDLKPGFAHQCQEVVAAIKA